jgi:hypothetical protein
MAISLSEIQSEFEKFFNEENPYQWDYENPPTIQEVQNKLGDLWETIFKNGFASVVPSSTAINSAAKTLGDFLRNNAAVNDGGAGFYAAVSQFYSTIMNSMPGYSLTSIPIPLVLSAPTGDKILVSSTFANQIVNNAKTGVVTNTVTMTPQNLS